MSQLFLYEKNAQTLDSYVCNVLQYTIWPGKMQDIKNLIPSNMQTMVQHTILLQ